LHADAVSGNLPEKNNRGVDMPLPPTSPRLLDPEIVPYFLWDLGITIAEARQILVNEASPTRDDLIARILREANSRDVWVLLDWTAIEEAWPRIVHRLGRARAVWTMMLERRQEHARTITAA
jgi:hypothetical protein